MIQADAHRALIDLREVLEPLRGGADGHGPLAPERPQPTLRDVPELVAEARATGTKVTLSDEVHDVDRAPETVGRHAYRMIQEGLTNARRHAPDTPVEVRLSGAPDEASGWRCATRCASARGPRRRGRDWVWWGWPSGPP